MSETVKLIDHTLLKADTSFAEVRRICEEAKKFGFAAVCIPPHFVRDTRRLLDDLSPRTKVATVVGFPMGYCAIAAKSEEIKRATDEGADEIDAVVNLAAIKSGQWNHVGNDIEAMALATNMRGRTLKLILECGLLSEEEIKRLCELADSSRIKWLVTGTGFHGPAVTPEILRNLRACAPDYVKIKAAGGIRTMAEAEALAAAGADRLGTSLTVEMMGGKV